MGRRKEKRVKAVLPVKVSESASQGKPLGHGHTLEVSRSGVRLGGVSGSLQAGETYAVQYRTTKARYRVQWVKGADKDVLVGLIALEKGKEPWGIALPREEPDDFVVEKPARPSRRYEKRTTHERRRHARHPVSGVGQIASVRGESGREAQVRDISREGCYVETEDPMPANTLLRILIKIAATEVEAVGVVRASFPKVGMGIQFTDMSPSDSQTLKGLLDRLEHETARKG